MYTEDDLLPISAVQHLLFCPRQCALIHVEGVWQENRLTAEGRVGHERVHEAPDESRRDVRIVRALRLQSLQLGLAGVADVVELHRADAPAESERGDGAAVRVPSLPGRWTVFPIEYKRGRPKRNQCDQVQLCAQAMCLEEMLSAAIPEGALFYGRTRRRHRVVLDAALRQRTRGAAGELHRLIDSGVTPPPDFSARCKSCSLQELCLPQRTARAKSASSYVRKALAELLQPGGDDDGGHT